MNNLVARAKLLRDNHRGEQFNVNYASVDSIRKIANCFTDHRIPNVDKITNINKIVQYMIASKMVGFNALYQKLSEATGEELDRFCDSIEIEDNCYDNFDTAIARHLYRENPRIYEYLTTKHIRYLDAGLVAFSTCHDIFLPDYKSIIDVASWKAELEVKELIENSEKKFVDFPETYKKHSIGRFVYADNRLRCTSRIGDPVDLDDDDIYEVLVDENYNFDEFKITNFIMNSLGSKNGSIKSYRKVKIDKLNQGDAVCLKDGLLYRNETQKCYMIVGPHKFVHMNKYQDLNQMSVVYLFKDKFGRHVDMIRLNTLSCDTIDFEDWCENHAENELKAGYIYLFKGRVLASKVRHSELNITYEKIVELLESI